MISLFCSLKLAEVTILLQSQPFLTSFICVLNLTFSVVATVGNLLVIRALWKASSIPATSKTLLLNLAFSDLAVGFYVQPMSGVVIAVMLNMASSENYHCFCPTVITLTMFLTYFLAGVSFFTIAAIALDRFLAVTLHLRYQAIVTEKRVRFGLILLWLTIGLATFVLIALPSRNNLFFVLVQGMGFVVITVAYFRIYIVMRHHQSKIHIQCQIQNEQAMKAAREKKSALNAFYVYIISLICYLPSTFSSILLDVSHLQISYITAGYAAIFMVFFNSSLNPLVYCWRYREIRNTVMSTVKKTFRINNQTAHHANNNLFVVYPHNETNIVKPRE